MSDSVLEAAKAKRDAALAEARRWSDFIKMYSEVTGPAQDGQVTPRGESPRPTQAAGGALAETEARVIAIVSRYQRPMPTRELLEALAAEDFLVGGQDPLSTLSARLSRAPKLTNIRGRGWWFSETAGDNQVLQPVSPAEVQPFSAPVKPGEEVAHDTMNT